MELNIIKFKNWIEENSGEIEPSTNKYEKIRFRGIEVGILYKSGKTNNEFTDITIHEFKLKKIWSGRPIKMKRDTNKKTKIKIIQRDGCDCFYCGKPLEDDITIEHLVSLVSGGTNKISNLVLSHEVCNLRAGNMALVNKVKIAIKNRVKNDKA